VNIVKYAFESMWMWFVLLVMAIGTVSFAYSTDAANKEALQQIFQSRQDKIIQEIEHAVVNYERLLRGGHGLFLASNQVDRDEWQAYAQALHLEEAFPGIRAFAYARFLPQSELTEYQRKIVEEGFEHFKVYPSGEREYYAPATYLEPFNEVNAKVLGYDMWSEEFRQRAMIAAAEKNQAVISSRVTLVEDRENNSTEAGFLMFFPVYKTQQSEDRSLENLDGFVYGLFRVSDLLTPVLQNFSDVRVEVFDGERVVESQRMFVSDKGYDRTVSNGLQSVHTITLNNHTWTFRFTALPGFVSGVDEYRPVIVLVVGFVICLLAFAALLSMRSSKRFAEVVAAERTSDLVQSEEQFRSAMESSPVGMALVSTDGGWLKVNKALCEMIGYSEKELLQTDFQTLTHADDLDADIEQLKQTLAGEISSYSMEKRYIRKDGEIIWGLLSVSLLRDEHGNPRHFVSQILDITDIKKSTQELKEANAELEEFTYRTSHDLRSPIMSALGLLQHTQGSLKDEDLATAKTSVDLAHASLLKLEALLQDILELGRMKNADEEKQNVDLNVIVDDALEKFAHMDGFERLDVRVDMQHKGDVFSKRTRVLMIVENLISNAIKYQDTDKDASFVKISSTDEKGFVVVTVEDNGLGIPEDHREYMFMMFKRFHPRTSFGSGLGLYMMKKSADIIGAEIKYSDTGNGSRFELFIPQQS